MFEPSIPPPLPPMANPDSEQPPWVPLGTKDCSQGFCSIYCPHWCYIVFPPPPPFAFVDNEDGSSGSPAFSPLAITIIGILASAFLLISYYTIVSRLCGGSSFHIHRHRRRRRHDDVGAHVPPTAGLDEASIDKITVCKYRRGGGPVGCSDCPVCLGEFLEDESLRLLPECGHAFHVRCIDTWLKSHSNCPLCRADVLLVNAAPPPPPPPPPETNRPDGVRNDEMGESGDGTGLENGSGSSLKEFCVIEIGEDECRRMRRSLSMDSFRRNRVSVADIPQVDMEDDRSEAADAEISVVGNSSQRSRGEQSKGSSRSSSSSLRCDSPIAADEEIGV